MMILKLRLKNYADYLKLLMIPSQEENILLSEEM